jgi:ubiquinone/menaquinone biosynthesis C-methylase UbiE
MVDNESIFLSVNEGYNRWAEFYDQDDIPLNILEEEIVERALGDVTGLKIVDLACGTGRQTAQLAKRGANVVGVDQSEGMLAKAKTKSPDIEFMLANLETTFPFGDNQFDLVVSFLALEHINDLRAFFLECKRICRREGTLYFTAMHPAMILRGVQARFTEPGTGKKVYPKGHVYQICDYLNASVDAGLRLVSMTEHSTKESHATASERALKYQGWPLLLTLKFSP